MPHTDVIVAVKRLEHIRWAVLPRDEDHLIGGEHSHGCDSLVVDGKPYFGLTMIDLLRLQCRVRGHAGSLRVG